MNWIFTTASIASTKVRFHAAVLIFLAWIGIADYLAGGPSAAAETIAFNLPVFLCLTQREFGRIFMVKRFGANAADAILSPIGGVAAMARMPEKPRQELPAPIARPLANVAAGFLLMLPLRPRPVPRHTIDLDHAGMAGRLLTVNAVLVAFNLIPAFPMDGRRVLRAALAMNVLT